MRRFKLLALLGMGMLISCGSGTADGEALFRSGTQALSDTGLQPSIVVNPSVLNFGEQQVGTVGAVLTVTVSNTGTSTLTVTSISISQGPFTVTPASPFSVVPGASQVLSVAFAPTVEGVATATLTLTTNDPNHAVVSVPLTGVGVNPVLSVSPTSLLFGAVPVGGSSIQTLTVANIGTGTLAISSLALSGTGAAHYTVTPSMLSVPPAGSATVVVTFAPTAPGPSSATLTLTSNDVSSPSTAIALSGTGGGAIATLNVTALFFGDVRVGSSAQRTVRLTNTGAAPLVVSQVQSSSPVFTYVGPASVVIAPGSFLDFQVAFSPSSPLIYAEILTFTSNADNSPTVLNLTGVGAGPIMSVTPTSIDFGGVPVGTVSAKVPVTVTNTGNAPFALQGLPVQGSVFTVALREGAALPVMIPPSGTFTFDVIFKPPMEGPVVGSVTLLTDLATDAPKVMLAGTGTVAKVQLSTTVFDFGGQRVGHSSGVHPLVVTNTGSVELIVTAVIFSNPAFTLGSTPPSEEHPLRVAPGQLAMLPVIFSPTVLGVATGKLFIISNAFEPAPPVDLTGKGIDGQFTLTPSVVSFGPVEVNGAEPQRKSVTVKNTGDYPLTITGVEPPAESAFSVSGLPEGLVLQPNETFAFTVAFAPSMRGYVNTMLVLQSDAVTNPLFLLPMEGTGVAAAVELQPQTLNFGASNVAVPVTRDLTIKNTGEKELLISDITFEDTVTGPPGTAQDFGLDGSVVFPMAVPPGQSALIRLKFAPRAVGPREAQVAVLSNAPIAKAALKGTGTSPGLVLSPSNVEFGQVRVGTSSAPRLLTLTNAGSGPLTLTSMVLGGADAAAFVVSLPSLPRTLQPNASVELAVAMKPDAERVFTAMLVIETDDADAPAVSVLLSGVGVAARQQLQLSESTLGFGQQLVHHPSSPRTVRVINNGDIPATLATLALEGEGISQFSLAPLALPIVVAPGQAQEVNVTFTPRVEDEVEGTLKFVFSDPPVQLEAALYGRGIPAVLALEPAALDFGAVRPNGGKREQALTLTNLSSETIILSAPEALNTTGEPFTHDGASLLGRELEPGASVSVTVGYQPQVETLSETTLSFGTTVPPRPRAVDARLKGRATRHVITADPGTLDFGNTDVDVPVEPKVVTLLNKSTQPQQVVVMLEDAEGTAFSVDAPALSEPIPAGGSATFKVAFHPRAPGEAWNEVQVWVQGATEAEALIPVAGNGTGQEDDCSCGSAGGSPALLALLALGVLGTRRRKAVEARS